MNRASVILNRLNTGIALLLVSILILFPLLLVFGKSFRPGDEWSLLAPLEVITERSLTTVYFNSLLLGLLVVVGATLFAAPLAFLMTKTSLAKHHRWLDLVLLIPFMTPPYISAMGWILFMQPKGFRDQLLPGLGFTTPIFFSLFGIVLVMSLHLFPFIYLMLKNTLMRVGGSLEEAAAVHGGNFLYRFKRIIIPLIVSGYSMGALLIFVKTISEFGTPATLGKRIGFYVLTTEIHRFTSTWPIDFGKAAALSSILLTTSMLIWYIQHLLANRFAYPLIGGKGQRSLIYPLKKWGLLAWSYVIFLLILAFGIPYFSIISTSMMKLWGYGLAWDNFTFDHYRELLSFRSAGAQALFTSLKLALLSATMCLLVGTFLALVIRRTRGWTKKTIDVSSLLSNTVPAIVIIVGLILLWNAPWLPLTFYHTSFMLALTYAVLFLPYTVQYVKANLEQIGNSLTEAATVSGADALFTLRNVILPLIVPGMIAGWMMTFTISSRELVGSMMIRPPGVETTATFIFSQFEQGNASLGMAMAVCSVGLTTLVLLYLQRFQKRM
jgi:iron(III) transport system permease protein